MREIKFRAWIKHWNTKGEGFSHEDRMIYDFNNDKHFGFDLYKGRAVVILKIGNFVHNENFYELMQFTGLHDKNGKEIWEGDTVKRSYSEKYPFLTGIVQWNSLEAKFEAHFHFPTGGAVSMGIGHYLNKEYVDEALEVIGNIYENPELLKQGSGG